MHAFMHAVHLTTAKQSEIRKAYLALLDRSDTRSIVLLRLDSLPRGYRVWASQAELYDAMIYVSDAHPIKVIED